MTENNKDHDAQQQSRLNEFNQLNTPMDKANPDFDLLLHQYFLAHPASTKQLLRLPGLTASERALVHEAAEEIPGLFTASGGSEPFRTLVIGWNREAV